VETSRVHGVADGSRTVAEHREGLAALLFLLVRELAQMMSWFVLIWSDVSRMLREV
jgi:hypothetical protein